MIWLAAATIAAAGIALIIWRRPAAYWQGMVIGGSTPAGCAVAEGVALLLIAIIAVVFVRQG